MEDGTFEGKIDTATFYSPSVATNFTSASSLALLGYQDFRLFVLRCRDDRLDCYEPVLFQRLRAVAD